MHRWSGLLTALGWVAAACALPAVAQPGAAAAEIASVEARLEGALARRDRAALEDLVAEAFTWIHASDGRIDTRDVWMRNAAGGMALSGQRLVRTEHGVTTTWHGGSDAGRPSAVVRISRVRLRDASGERESWIRQARVYVMSAAGTWRLASGQGTLMYEGRLLDASLHARYAGTYVIDRARTLELTWDDETLLARFPDGSTTQIFLASATEEVVRVPAAGQLRFALGADGQPVAASLVRAGRELWKGVRDGR